MVKKIKFSKLAIVIFLTLLIWVWADRALEEEYPIQTATIVVGRTRPDLWVSFPKGPVIDVNKITLSGPSSIINELDRKIKNDFQKVEFSFYPEQFKIDKAGEYPIKVQDIIEQSSWIKEFGLSVKECDPVEVQVTAIELKKQEIDVQCYNEADISVNLETPKKVSMYVPTDWRVSARVDLSDDDVDRATQQPISVTPYIILPNGEKRDADSSIDIQLSPQEDILRPTTINNAKYWITLSPNLLNGHYVVEVKEESLREFLTIEVLGTSQAIEAYENQDYQVTLEILNRHIAESENGFARNEVRYMLPEEFVRKNQIKLAHEKKEALFKVKLVETNENGD